MNSELFLVVRFEEVLERIQAVTVAETTIGRLPTCSVCLPNSAVSRTHALLTRTATGFQIRDLNSRNGTLLNGQPLTESVLTIPAVIGIGPYQINVFDDLVAAQTEAGGDAESTCNRPEPARHGTEQKRRQQLLTPAQSLVYHQFLLGYTEKEVAQALKISINTVHTHARAIYAKLKVTSRGELLSQSAGKLTVHG